MIQYCIYVIKVPLFVARNGGNNEKKVDMTRIKKQRSEKEGEGTFLLNSINLWMNNFISFRRNHVLLPASYTHVRLYTDAFPHLHTFWRICATNDVQKSRVQAAWIYRRTIDIMPDAVRASSARSLFPLHFFINPFSPKSLFGKNIDWVCQGSYEYWYEWILISIKT